MSYAGNGSLMAYANRGGPDKPLNQHSLIKTFSVRRLYEVLTTHYTGKTLKRLDGCAGRSRSLLSAHTILRFLS